MRPAPGATEWAICGPDSVCLDCATAEKDDGCSKALRISFQHGLVLKLEPVQQQQPEASSTPTVQGTEGTAQGGGQSPEVGAQSPKEPLNEEPGQQEVAGRRLQVMRAGAMRASGLVGSGPILDSTGSGMDISTMSVSEVERHLKTGEDLPGWNGRGHPQKDLGYIKIFFNATTMQYHPETLWPKLQSLDPETARGVKMLDEQLVLMRKHGDFEKLSEESAYDLAVIQCWVKHLQQGVVPHGPLLGWAKLKGHELYYHLFNPDEPPFLMARIPNTPYSQQLELEVYLLFLNASKHYQGQGKTNSWRIRPPGINPQNLP